MNIKIGEKISKAKIGNIPLWNLREEFDCYYNFLSNPNNEVYFGYKAMPIHSSHMIWLGMKDDFMTLIMQRAILGAEAYVPAIIRTLLVELKIYKDNHKELIQNPYNLLGNSVPDKYYNRLPELVSDEMSLKNFNYEDWKIVDKFYRKVRNPLFHGKQLYETDLETVLDGYNVISKIYKWIDFWFPASKI